MNHIPRNSLIARMLFLIKEIEQWGTGTNEMVNMCLEHGLPEPEFEEMREKNIVVRKGAGRKTHYELL